MVRNIITLLTLGTDLHIMSRYVWRIINPVGQLSRRKHVDEVSAVAGHQDMLARNDHGSNHDVGIALPPAMLASQEQTLGNGTCYIKGHWLLEGQVAQPADLTAWVERAIQGTAF